MVSGSVLKRKIQTDRFPDAIDHEEYYSERLLEVFRRVVVVVQSLSRVRLFATPWTAARQASLSFTNSQSLLKLMSIESVMPPNHLILCCSFSSCLLSFPASGSVPISLLFASGGQSIGALPSVSVLPMSIQD